MKGMSSSDLQLALEESSCLHYCLLSLPFSLQRPTRPESSRKSSPQTPSSTSSPPLPHRPWRPSRQATSTRRSSSSLTRGSSWTTRLERTLRRGLVGRTLNISPLERAAGSVPGSSGADAYGCVYAFLVSRCCCCCCFLVLLCRSSPEPSTSSPARPSERTTTRRTTTSSTRETLT